MTGAAGRAGGITGCGFRQRVPRRAGRGPAGGTGRPPGRDAGSGVPGRGGMGSRQPDAVPARRASAAGPGGMPGGRLRCHRAWHHDRRAVLAVLRPAHPGGHERRGDHLIAGAAAAAGPPARVRGSRVPADVAGRKAGAADRPVPGSFAPVPPGPRDDDGTVPGRPAGAAAARPGPVQRGGLRPARRKRARLLPHPLRAVAAGGHGLSRGRGAALAADRAGGFRGRPGEPAGIAAAGGDRGAVRDLAAHR